MFYYYFFIILDILQGLALLHAGVSKMVLWHLQLVELLNWLDSLIINSLTAELTAFT